MGRKMLHCDSYRIGHCLRDEVALRRSAQEGILRKGHKPGQLGFCPHIAREMMNVTECGICSTLTYFHRCPIRVRLDPLKIPEYNAR